MAIARAAISFTEATQQQQADFRDFLTFQDWYPGDADWVWLRDVTSMVDNDENDHPVAELRGLFEILKQQLEAAAADFGFKNPRADLSAQK